MLSALTVLVATAASTQPVGHTDEHTSAKDHVREEDTPRVWYGWQLLPGDAAAAVSFCVGVALLDSNRSVGRPLMTFGEIIFLANGPTVHTLHDHTTKGAGSFGMRLLFPLGGHAIGVIVGSRTVDLVGVIGAGLMASAVDVALLAFDEADPPRWARWIPTPTLERDARGGTAPTLTLGGSL